MLSATSPIIFICHPGYYYLFQEEDDKMEENLKKHPILTNLTFVTTLQGPNATQKYWELSLKSECGSLKSE